MMPSEGRKGPVVVDRLPYGLNLDNGSSGATTFVDAWGIVDGTFQLVDGPLLELGGPALGSVRVFPICAGRLWDTVSFCLRGPTVSALPRSGAL